MSEMRNTKCHQVYSLVRCVSTFELTYKNRITSTHRMYNWRSRLSPSVPTGGMCGEGLGDWRPASLELLVLGGLAPHHMVCPQVRYNSTCLFTFENYVAADNSRMHIAKCHQVWGRISRLATCSQSSELSSSPSSLDQATCPQEGRSTHNSQSYTQKTKAKWGR